MKKLLIATVTLIAGVIVTRADIKPVDSEGPILKYFEAIQTQSKSKTSLPNFKVNEKKPLLTINSLRDLIVRPDGTVIAVLNETDKKTFARLTHQLNGGLVVCTGTRNFMAIGITSPTDDGILEFSEARHSGDTAKYLRRRFGK